MICNSSLLRCYFLYLFCGHVTVSLSWSFCGALWFVESNFAVVSRKTLICKHSCLPLDH
uniref:Uncharacterized protein n=1 Tax=Arundo donax TaxID=35708 RepID=A0A0A9EH90_ARUDO